MKIKITHATRFKRFRLEHARLSHSHVDSGHDAAGAGDVAARSGFSTQNACNLLFHFKMFNYLCALIIYTF